VGGAIKSGSFLGTGWAFPPQFSSAGQVSMVSDETDIGESLRILLWTRPGERVMHPLYGCGIRTVLFENITETLRTEVRAMVTSAIERCEPRVSVELVSVYPDGQDHDILKVEVAYRIKATNAMANMVFPFYLGNASADHA
jgi:uncharacterized protein